MKKSFLIALLMASSLSAMAQNTADPNMARAEKMFGFLLENKADSLYDNLSPQVKPMVQKTQFEGLLKNMEQQIGVYQKHGGWETQQVMGQKCYVSVAQFEKAELGAVVVFDAEGKMLGIQLVPASMVKKM